MAVHSLLIPCQPEMCHRRANTAVIKSAEVNIVPSTYRVHSLGYTKIAVETKRTVVAILLTVHTA